MVSARSTGWRGCSRTCTPLRRREAWTAQRLGEPGQVGPGQPGVEQRLIEQDRDRLGQHHPRIHEAAHCYRPGRPRPAGSSGGSPQATRQLGPGFLERHHRQICHSAHPGFVGPARVARSACVLMSSNTPRPRATIASQDANQYLHHQPGRVSPRVPITDPSGAQEAVAVRCAPAQPEHQQNRNAAGTCPRPGSTTASQGPGRDRQRPRATRPTSRDPHQAAGRPAHARQPDPRAARPPPIQPPPGQSRPRPGPGRRSARHRSTAAARSGAGHPGGRWPYRPLQRPGRIDEEPLDADRASDMASVAHEPVRDRLRARYEPDQPPAPPAQAGSAETAQPGFASLSADTDQRDGFAHLLSQPRGKQSFTHGPLQICRVKVRGGRGLLAWRRPAAAAEHALTPGSVYQPGL